MWFINKPNMEMVKQILNNFLFKYGYEANRKLGLVHYVCERVKRAKYWCMGWKVYNYKFYNDEYDYMSDTRYSNETNNLKNEYPLYGVEFGCKDNLPKAEDRWKEGMQNLSNPNKYKLEGDNLVITNPNNPWIEKECPICGGRPLDSCQRIMLDLDGEKVFQEFQPKKDDSPNV